MSVKQPQTIALVVAILTLFAATAPGQQKGTDIPVYESGSVIFGKSVVTGDGSSILASMQEEIEFGGEFKVPDIDVLNNANVPEVPQIQIPDLPDFPAANTPNVPQVPDFEVPKIKDLDSNEPSSPVRQAAHRTGQEADSLFGGSNRPLVDKNGYFLPARNGGLWSDAARAPESLDPTSAFAQANQASASAPLDSGQPLTEEQARLQQTILSESQNQNYVPANYQSPGSSKLRLRVGFDVLLWERGRPNNDVFATDANGQEFSFADFDLKDGTPRFFIQYMGDDLSGIEFTFYDFNGFEGSILAQGSSVIPQFFGSSPALVGDSYELNYSSRLKNIELNWWIRNSPCLRTGWGLRHINLDENFNVITSGTGTGLLSRTNNDLYGAHRMWERRRPVANRMDLTCLLYTSPSPRD